MKNYNFWKLLLVFFCGALVSCRPKNLLQQTSTTQGNIKASLSYLDTSHYPEIHLLLRIEGTKKNLIEGLNPGKIQLQENGETIPPEVRSLLQPKRVSLLVLDRSESMKHYNKQTKAILAAKAFYQLMEPGDRSGLVTFSTQADLVQLFTQDKKKLQQALETISLAGTTYLYDALWMSLKEIGTQEGNKVILALTDGKDKDSVKKPAELIQLAREKKVRIFLIGLGTSSEVDTKVLNEIAQKSGGKAYQTTSKEQLERIYSSIALELRHEYSLKYRSPFAATGQTRHLQVTIQTLQEMLLLEIQYNLGGLIPKIQGRVTSKKQAPHLIFLHYSVILILSGLLPLVGTQICRWYKKSKFARKYILKLRAGNPYIRQVCANEQDEETQFLEGDEVVICPECKALHHRDCWEFNGFRCFNTPPCRGRGEWKS